MSLRKWFLRTFTGPEFIVSSIADRDDNGRATDILVHTHAWCDADEVMAAVQRKVRDYVALRVERREPQWWLATVVYREGYSGPVA